MFPRAPSSRSGRGADAIRLQISEPFERTDVRREALCEVLWRRIDPTLRNQVGLDRGATS